MKANLWCEGVVGGQDERRILEGRKVKERKRKKKKSKKERKKKRKRNKEKRIIISPPSSVLPAFLRVPPVIAM